MVQMLRQPFHADLQPVLAAPLKTPFDELPMLLKEKEDRKDDLLASRGASRMVHVATRINEHPAMKRHGAGTVDRVGVPPTTGPSEVYVVGS